MTAQHRSAAEEPDPRPADPTAAAEPGTSPAADAEAQDSAAEVKRRFREALERKNAPHGGHEGGPGAGDASKVHGRHGPASAQRTFRRKSG